MSSGSGSSRRRRDALQSDSHLPPPYRHSRSVLHVRESMRRSPPSRCVEICAHGPRGVSRVQRLRAKIGAGAHLGDNVKRQFEEQLEAEDALLFVIYLVVDDGLRSSSLALLERRARC